MLSLELAVCWLSAGRVDAAREQLIAWKRDWPQPVVRLGNQEIAVFGDGEDPCQWLEREVSCSGRFRPRTHWSTCC